MAGDWRNLPPSYALDRNRDGLPITPTEYLDIRQQFVLQIPRPVLTLPHLKAAQQQENQQNELIYDLSGMTMAQHRRPDTPTRFTLLGQPGIVRPSRTLSTWQLSFTVCAIVLLALVGMIVYMEVYMQESRI